MVKVRRAPKPKSIKKISKGYAVGSRPTAKRPTVRQVRGPVKPASKLQGELNKVIKSFNPLPEAAGFQAPARVVYEVVTKGGKALVNRHGQTIRRGRVEKQPTTLAESEIARSPTPVIDQQGWWKKQKKIKIKGYPRGSVSGKPQYNTLKGVTVPASYPVELSSIGSVTRGQQGDVLGRIKKTGKITKTSFDKITPGFYATPDNTGFNPVRTWIKPRTKKVTTNEQLVMGQAPQIKVQKFSKQKKVKGSGSRRITEFGVVGGAAGGVGTWDQITSFFNQPLIPEASAAIGVSAITKQIAKLSSEVQSVKDGKMMFISIEKRDKYVKSRVEKIVKLEQKLEDRGGIAEHIHYDSQVDRLKQVTTNLDDRLGGQTNAFVESSILSQSPTGTKVIGKKTVELLKEPKGSLADDMINIPFTKDKIKIHDDKIIDEAFGKIGGNLKGKGLSKRQQKIITATGGFAVAGGTGAYIHAGWGITPGTTTALDQQIKQKQEQVTSTTDSTQKTTPEPVVGHYQPTGGASGAYAGTLAGEHLLKGDRIAAQQAYEASLAVTGPMPRPGLRYLLPDESGLRDPSWTMIQGQKTVGGKLVLYDQWVRLGATSGVSATRLEEMYTRQSKAQNLNQLISGEDGLKARMAAKGGDIYGKALVAQTFYKENPSLGKLPSQYTKIIKAYSKPVTTQNMGATNIAWHSSKPHFQKAGDGTVSTTIKIIPSGYKPKEEKK